MQDISDDILIQAAKGDIQAFEKVYKTYAPFVYNVAYRMVEAKEDAEEITSEVFLTIHKKLSSFMFRSSLRTWVYRITVNCSINTLNKRKSDRRGIVDVEDVLNFVASPSDQLKQSIEAEDQEHKIRALLNVLNPDERACIVLRNIEGLSYEDIARSLGVNINTVRSRLKRGLAKMAAIGKEAQSNG